MQPSERNRQLNKERYDVLSIPSYVIKKNPTHGARHGPSMRQHMCYKAHEMLKKARMQKMVVTKTFWTDGTTMTNTASFCQILGGLRIALEDHSYVATQQQRSRNEKSWKLSLNTEGIQGPVKQRSDFKEEVQTCTRLYHEYTAITGSRNKLIPPGQQVRQRLDEQFKALKNTIIDLKLRQDGNTILLPRCIHLRQHDGYQGAICGQLGAGTRGNHHPGLNSEFFL